MFNLEEELKKEHQKSYLFLYPLLNLPMNIKPINTFLGFKDVESTEPVLILLMHEDLANYATQKAILKANKYYVTSFEESGYEYFIFNLNEHATSYDLIVGGLYSHVKQNIKVRIAASATNKLTSLALYPEFVKDDIMMIFETKSGPNEILSPPNKETEYLTISKELISKIEGVL